MSKDDYAESRKSLLYWVGLLLGFVSGFGFAYLLAEERLFVIAAVLLFLIVVACLLDSEISIFCKGLFAELKVQLNVLIRILLFRK